MHLNACLLSPKLAHLQSRIWIHVGSVDSVCTRWSWLRVRVISCCVTLTYVMTTVYNAAEWQQSATAKRDQNSEVMISELYKKWWSTGEWPFTGVCQLQRKASCEVSALVL